MLKLSSGYFLLIITEAAAPSNNRSEIIATADELGLDVAKIPAMLSILLSFAGLFPIRIRATAPEGEEWRVTTAGRARYRFDWAAAFRVEPDPLLAETKIPDATPGVISKYALSDEQALLAKLRYNRLVDIFSGVTCYSLQNHLRTTVQLARLNGNDAD